MNKKISEVSKRILLIGTTVCVALCMTYILWNVFAFRDTIYVFSKERLAAEAGKLMLTCIIELLIGSCVIDRIAKNGGQSS